MSCCAKWHLPTMKNECRKFRMSKQRHGVMIMLSVSNLITHTTFSSIFRSKTSICGLMFDVCVDIRLRIASLRLWNYFVWLRVEYDSMHPLCSASQYDCRLVEGVRTQCSNKITNCLLWGGYMLQCIYIYIWKFSSIYFFFYILRPRCLSSMLLYFKLRCKKFEDVLLVVCLGAMDMHVWAHKCRLVSLRTHSWCFNKAQCSGVPSSLIYSNQLRVTTKFLLICLFFVCGHAYAMHALAVVQCSQSENEEFWS